MFGKNREDPLVDSVSDHSLLNAQEEEKLLSWMKRLDEMNFDSVEIGKSPLFAALAKVQERFVAMSKEMSFSSGCLQKSSAQMNEKSKQVRDSVLSISSEIDEVTERTSETNTNMMTVASATEELSINMNQIASVAGEIRDTTITLSNNLDELTNSAIEIAHNTEIAASVTEKAKYEVSQTTERINGLGRATNEIGEVVEVIAEIAEQTKLLALNATIEAARAGEAGRGFAVVASEVKNLAQETNNATQNIRDKIDSIQEESAKTVASVETINSVIIEVNDVVTTIASASEEQSVTSKTISAMSEENSSRLEVVAENVEQGAIAIQDVNISINGISSLTDSILKTLTVMSDESSAMEMASVANYALALENDGQGKMLEDLLSDITCSEAKAVYNEAEPLFCRYTSHFDVQVNAFNRDHIHIFDLINKIHDFIKNENIGESMLKTIKELAAFCVEHFKREEIEMEKFNYPGFADHKKIHEKLLSQVSEIVQKAENGEKQDLIAILLFLKKWLYSHIHGVDMNYSAFLNDHGVV